MGFSPRKFPVKGKKVHKSTATLHFQKIRMKAVTCLEHFRNLLVTNQLDSIIKYIEKYKVRERFCYHLQCVFR